MLAPVARDALAEVRAPRRPDLEPARRFGLVVFSGRALLYALRAYLNQIRTLAKFSERISLKYFVRFVLSKCKYQCFLFLYPALVMPDSLRIIPSEFICAVRNSEMIFRKS